jgi:dCMP deaminase
MTPELEYLRQACQIARRDSHDPRTHVGAILVSRAGLPVYAANQIPPGVLRNLSRTEPPRKYKFMEHAERNAIYAAASAGICTREATLYAPWFSCADCARGIICAGIKEVVGLASLRAATPERWERDIAMAEQMMQEAGVVTRWLSGVVGESIRFDDKDIAV